MQTACWLCAHIGLWAKKRQLHVVSNVASTLSRGACCVCIARFKLGLKWGHIAGFMGLQSQSHCTACKQLLLLHCVCFMSWCHPDFLLQAVLVQCNDQLLHAIAFGRAPRVATQYFKRIAACKVLATALSHHVTYIIVTKS